MGSRKRRNTMKAYIIKHETASFDVDPQVGFSPLAPNELPVTDAQSIVPELNKQATIAKYRLASKDTHNPNGAWIADEKNPQFSPVGLPNVYIRWNRHCQLGTLGFDFIAGLPKPLDYDFISYKGIEFDSHPYGAAYHDLADTRSTGVIEFLKQKEVTTVILGGLATDFCVKTTAIQLKKAGFDIIVNLAACRAINFNGSEKAALEEMAALGIKIVEKTEDIIVVR
jgi:nicotinamidase/pyrazinamidase